MLALALVLLWLLPAIGGLAALVMSFLPETVNKPFLRELGVTLLVVWFVCSVFGAILARYIRYQSRS